ncbi:MAG TPA: GNAT family N-acetyltransferase [Terriglobales bacterium]|nr:GNAT family N-acetyltransferase [Terriglobales bacterium]
MENLSSMSSMQNSSPVPVPTVRVRPFQPGDEAAFRSLNEAWIAKYFGIEKEDRIVLEDPVGHILAPGGHIFIAVADKEPVGCCALKFMEPGVFEVAKMTVSERLRGFGIGRQVLEYTIGQAIRLGATRLYLETNNTVQNAIHLYESVGFRHLPPERVHGSLYVRANVFMEMDLE